MVGTMGVWLHHLRPADLLWPSKRLIKGLNKFVSPYGGLISWVTALTQTYLRVAKTSTELVINTEKMHLYNRAFCLQARFSSVPTALSKTDVSGIHYAI